MKIRKSIRTARLAAPVLIALSLAFPAGVLGHTNEQLARTGGMTATLPLLAASLTVEVKLDVVGNITEVSLDPAGVVSQTKAGDHKVKFANADGSVRVDVKAKGSKLSIKARAGTLQDLVGSGTWSAAVFGTGTSATVAYTVGNAGGHPTLSIGTTTSSHGTFEVSPIKTSHDGDKVAGKVTFSFDGYSKKLSITVEVKKDGRASLKIALSGKDKQRLAGSLADLAGARTWSAHTCDGEPVGVSFHVNADGTVAFDSASGGEVNVKEQKHGFKASFEGTKLGVSVQLKAKDGSYQLKVDGKSGKCGKHDKDTKAKEKKDKPASDRKAGEDKAGEGDD